MLKYTLRYAPLLVLALFLIPWRIYTEENAGLPSPSQVSSLSGSGVYRNQNMSQKILTYLRSFL